jgi:hypothetical protein
MGILLLTLQPMNLSQIYSCWEDAQQKHHFFSFEDILVIGEPIDEDGIDMELVSDEVFVIGKNGYQKLSATDYSRK